MVMGFFLAEMMLYAFRDSMLQNYGNRAIAGRISEVYFRNAEQVWI
jgi:hypothetical protein